jgi:hypothetical protein
LCATGESVFPFRNDGKEGDGGGKYNTGIIEAQLKPDLFHRET